MKINASKRLVATDELTNKQKKLDINEDGKIDGQDLKKVRQGELNAKRVNAKTPEDAARVIEYLTEVYGFQPTPESRSRGNAGSGLVFWKFKVGGVPYLSHVELKTGDSLAFVLTQDTAGIPGHPGAYTAYGKTGDELIRNIKKTISGLQKDLKVRMKNDSSLLAWADKFK